MSDRTDRDTDGTAAAAWPPAGNARRDTVPPDAPVVYASTLFGRHRQVVITRHGKLILNNRIGCAGVPAPRR